MFNFLKHKDESAKTWLFRMGINNYPMFWGTGGKTLYIKSDWSHVTVGLKLGIMTRNYVGTIFGGSMFSAMDPFHIIMLMHLVGKDFIVWDKAAKVEFKKPGKKALKMDIKYDPNEVENIRQQAQTQGKYIFTKSADWIDADGDVVCTVEKTLYVATKEYFKNRSKS